MIANAPWPSQGTINPHSYTCGHQNCGRQVSSEKGWFHSDNRGAWDAAIYICPVCRRLTFFDFTESSQLPGVSIGSAVKDLPKEINDIWSEIRGSTSRGAYTSAVLAGRKLLMHIAVEQGAATGLSFVQYIDYMVSNHFAPPNSKVWIDKIRSHGNEANHEIVLKKREDAEEIMVFLEMLLRFIYEFPARAGVSLASNSASTP
jgi:hypothetical protein